MDLCWYTAKRTYVAESTDSRKLKASSCMTCFDCVTFWQKCHPRSMVSVTLVQMRGFCVHDMFDDTGGRLGAKPPYLLTSGDKGFIVALLTGA